MSEITPVIIVDACMVEQPKKKEKSKRIRMPSLRTMAVAAAVGGGAVGALLTGFMAGRASGGDAEFVAVPETTTSTTSPDQDYQVVLQENIELGKRELNARLLSQERCLSVFWGNVKIVENGEDKGLLQNPIVFNDLDLFFPAKGHKFGRPTGIENYDYAPYALVSNIDSASHEAAFNIYFLDNKEYSYQFADVNDQPVMPTGGMAAPDAPGFMSHVVCTNDVTLQRRPEDRTFYLSLADGTRVSQFVPNNG